MRYLSTTSKIGFDIEDVDSFNSWCVYKHYYIDGSNKVLFYIGVGKFHRALDYKNRSDEWMGVYNKHALIKCEFIWFSNRDEAYKHEIFLIRENKSQLVNKLTYRGTCLHK